MRRALPFALLLLCAVGCADRPGGGAPKALGARTLVLGDSLLNAPSDTIDLGRMHEGEVVSQAFTLRNGFDDPLLILSARTSCGCTSIEIPRAPIAPGEEAPFSFSFDSRGQRGLQLKSITLALSNDPRELRLVITGEVF